MDPTHFTSPRPAAPLATIVFEGPGLDEPLISHVSMQPPSRANSTHCCLEKEVTFSLPWGEAQALLLEDGKREVEGVGRRGEDLSKASLVGEVFRGSLEYIVNRMGVQKGNLKRCDKGRRWFIYAPDRKL